MTATFLVTLSISDTDLVSIASELEDKIAESGFDVVAVHPWARPSIAAPKVVGVGNPLPPPPSS